MSKTITQDQHAIPPKVPVKLKTLQRIFSMLKPYKLQVVGAMVALLFTAGSTLAIGQGLRFLIDEGFSGNDPSVLTTALLFLFGIGGAIAFGSFMRFYLMTWLGERVVADLRHNVFERIIELDVAFFETTRTGELLSRLTTDTTLLQTVIGSSFSLALRNTIVLFGGLVMMFVANAKLATVAVVLVPIIIVPVIYIGRKVRVLSKESQARVADVGAFAEESINAIRTVKAFTQEKTNLARFDQEVEGAFKTALRRARLRSTLSATVTVVVFVGLGSVLWVGGNDVIMGNSTGGELGAFVFYAIMVAMSVATVAEVYGELQRAAGAAARLLELLAVESKIQNPEIPKDEPVSYTHLTLPTIYSV